MRYLGAMIFALALAAPVAAQTGPASDLFAFSQGARLVQVPDDAEFTAMDSSPLNLIDGSATTDWTGEAGRPAVFVLELAERTELSRIAFDSHPIKLAEGDTAPYFSIAMIHGQGRRP